MVADLNVVHIAAACVLLGAVYYLHQARRHDTVKADFWTKIPIVGLPAPNLFPWARALVSSLTSLRKNVHDGYREVAKATGSAFAVPTVWKDGAVVVLPPTQLHLLHRPEREVKAYDAQLETIQLPYMFDDPDIYMNAIQFDVVRKHLVTSKDIEALAPTTAEEIETAFKDTWGVSEQWTEVNGWDVCGRIVTRAATRTLIGLPLCRDEVLFEQSRLFSDSVMAGTAILNCLPPLVRPVIGPLVALRARFYRRRCLQILVPFVESRLKLWRESKRQEDLPNDFVQWMIAKCAKDGPEQLEPNKLANRLLALNVMFVIAMAYVFAHCMVDIFGSPSADEFVQGLKQEYEQISRKHGGLSTKAAVDELHRTDSAIRESMRLSDVAVTALARDVVSGPLDLGNGLHVPAGVRIVWPTQAIHQDSSYYEDPLRFDPFRFSRATEGLDAADANSQNSSAQRESMSSITPSFLAFGYGRHACPGRWFAAQTLKLALTSLVMNYDVQVVNKPQGRTALLNMMIPATGVRLRIRRRG